MAALAFSAASDEQIAIQTRHPVGCACEACEAIRRQGPQLARPNGYLALLGERKGSEPTAAPKTKAELRAEARKRIKAQRLRGKRFSELVRSGRFAKVAAS